MRRRELQVKHWAQVMKKICARIYIYIYICGYIISWYISTRNVPQKTEDAESHRAQATQDPMLNAGVLTAFF